MKLKEKIQKLQSVINRNDPGTKEFCEAMHKFSILINKKKNRDKIEPLQGLIFNFKKAAVNKYELFNNIGAPGPENKFKFQENISMGFAVLDVLNYKHLLEIRLNELRAKNKSDKIYENKQRFLLDVKSYINQFIQEEKPQELARLYSNLIIDLKQNKDIKLHHFNPFSRQRTSINKKIERLKACIAEKIPELRKAQSEVYAAKEALEKYKNELESRVEKSKQAQRQGLRVIRERKSNLNDERLQMMAIIMSELKNKSIDMKIAEIRNILDPNRNVEVNNADIKQISDIDLTSANKHRHSWIARLTNKLDTQLVTLLKNYLKKLEDLQTVNARHPGIEAQLIILPPPAQHTMKVGVVTANVNHAIKFDRAELIPMEPQPQKLTRSYMAPVEHKIDIENSVLSKPVAHIANKADLQPMSPQRFFAEHKAKLEHIAPIKHTASRSVPLPQQPQKVVIEEGAQKQNAVHITNTVADAQKNKRSYMIEESPVQSGIRKDAPVTVKEKKAAKQPEAVKKTENGNVQSKIKFFNNLAEKEKSPTAKITPPNTPSKNKKNGP